MEVKVISQALAFASLLFLTSCTDTKLVEEQVAALNQRLDKLDVMSEEILVRASSMNELELTVSAMEERQTSRLRKILDREAIAKKRVLELDSEILEMEAKIQLLEEESKSYPKTQEAKKATAQARIEKLLAEVERTISLAPRPGEEKVVLIERLLEEIKSLRAENATLRGKLPKP